MVMVVVMHDDVKSCINQLLLSMGSCDATKGRRRKASRWFDSLGFLEMKIKISSWAFTIVLFCVYQ